MFSALRRWRRRRQADRMTVSTAQWEQVEQSLPFLAWRPAEDRPRLRRLALEVLAEKPVHGARAELLRDDRLNQRAAKGIADQRLAEEFGDEALMNAGGELPHLKRSRN